jgi:hypothetical protein
VLVNQQHMHLIQISLVNKLVLVHYLLTQISLGITCEATNASGSNFMGNQAGMEQRMLLSNFFGTVLVICNWCISIKFHWFSAGYEAKSAFGSNFIGFKLVIKQQMLKIQISW